MENLAHLGPTIPADAHDTTPVKLHTFGIINQLNGLGEAIVQMTVTPQHHPKTVVLISVNPRNLHIIRVTCLVESERVILDPNELPGHMADLAQSIVRDTFSVRDQ